VAAIFELRMSLLPSSLAGLGAEPVDPALHTHQQEPLNIHQLGASL
jgi:hypothetical protein